MRIVDYKLDHLLALNIDFDKYPICQGNIVIIANILKQGISKTILDDNKKVLAVISVMIYHPGVAGVHIIPDIDAHDSKKVPFIKAIISMRGKLEDIAREYKLRRIETLTVDDDKHNRWMQYLGFVADGVKQMYGVNGEDFIMWSRIWV